MKERMTPKKVRRAQFNNCAARTRRKILGAVCEKKNTGLGGAHHADGRQGGHEGGKGKIEKVIPNQL